MNNKIPPPIIALVCALGILFSKPFFKEYSNVNNSSISILFFLIGIACFFFAIKLFNKHNTTISPLKPEKATSLIVSGIYMYSRNPMYLGMLFILISTSIRFNIIGGIISISTFIIYITKFQIIPEEEQLKRIFGEKFLNYKKKTRMWL